MNEAHVEVAIIGAGPVGSVGANLAARHGLSCALIDPSTEVFALPRAIHFDADIMRIFQFAGLADRIEPLTRATTGGVHLGIDGEPIRRFRVRDEPGDLGWRPHYMFFQPELDALLRRAAASCPGVLTRFGWRCERVDADDSAAILSLTGPAGERAELAAEYVIAADGATSPTRVQLGLELDSYGFEEPWIIIDAQVPAEDLGPDYTIMYCDPERPGTYVPGPGRHRRWEFMVLPGERGEELQTPHRARELVDSVTPWLDGVELDVGRTAVYRFHGLVASKWRAGRVFLAGDAAHQTPPFYGQGMCHGIRDVRNLLWKLAAVRDDRSGPGLLDTYQAEREPHVRAIIEAAIANGRYICTLDREVAVERDVRLRERIEQGADVRSFREVIPGLSAGLLDDREGSDAIGLLFPQPRVTGDDRSPVLLDELLGDRFALISAVPIPDRAACEAWAATVGGVVLDLGSTLHDHDGTLERWFDAFGCVAALVRPDRYVFGVAESQIDMGALLNRSASTLSDLVEERG